MVQGGSGVNNGSCVQPSLRLKDRKSLHPCPMDQKQVAAFMLPVTSSLLQGASAPSGMSRIGSGAICHSEVLVPHPSGPQLSVYVLVYRIDAGRSATREAGLSSSHHHQGDPTAGARGDSYSSAQGQSMISCRLQIKPRFLLLPVIRAGQARICAWWMSSCRFD